MSSPHVVKKTRKPSPPSAAGAAATAAWAPLAHAKPVLHSYLFRIPEELLLSIADCLIPHSPFLQRPNQPAFHYPIASAMRDLRSLSLTCTRLNQLAGMLRLTRADEQFRELGSRIEFEHHELSPAARSACIERWGKDPALPNPRPQLHMRPVPDVLLTGDVRDAKTLAAFRAELQRTQAQVRTIHLHINTGEGLDLLASSVVACKILKQLRLSSNLSLAPEMLAWAVNLPLEELTLNAPGIEAGVIGTLAKSKLAFSLKSLTLLIKGLTAENLPPLAKIQLQELRLLTIGDAPLDQAACEALSKVLPDLPKLRGLTLGIGKGCIKAEGIKVLLTAVQSHFSIARLGLFQLDASAASDALECLRKMDKLEELTWGGPLPAPAASKLWKWLTESGLRSLALVDTKFDHQSWQDLTKALTGNLHLRELRISGEYLPDKQNADLPRAINKAGRLVRLSLDGCVIEECIAERLGRALATHPSLLAVQILLYKGTPNRNGPVDHDTSLRYISTPLRKRGKLLQFDVSRDISGAWMDLAPRLLENRLLGGETRADATSGLASPAPLPSATSPGITCAATVQSLPAAPSSVTVAGVTAATLPVPVERGATTVQAKRRRASPAEASVRRHRYAAALGDHNAGFALGEAYRLGKGVRKDARRAFQCYRDAAVAGHAAAQYQLGLAFGAGMGVASDRLRAVKWLRLSAEQGHAPALLLLGVCNEKGMGIAQDKQRAFFLYAQAADLGYAPAQFLLSVCYANGIGVKQKLDKALLWFERASAQSAAQSNRYGAKAIAALAEVATQRVEAGAALQEQGSRGQASAQFRKALAIRNAVLGCEHPESVALSRQLRLLEEAMKTGSS